MPVTGVLLAAGLGERLAPLTEAVPKPALSLLDVPLGAWGLCSLLSATDDVVVNVSHLGDLVVGALASYGAFETLDEGEVPWGTGSTLAALRDRVDDTVIVLSADMLTDLSPQALLEAHRRNDAPATIAVRNVATEADMIVEDGRAVRFVHRRRTPDVAGVQYLNLGVFDAEALSLLPERRPAGLAEHLLRPLVERGDLAVHRADAYAVNVGTPAHYLDASRDLLYGRGPQWPRPCPGEFLDCEGGSAYLGPGASGDEDALGPGAVVLAGAALHEGSHVSNAIVWPDEEVPAGRRVVDGVWAGGHLVPRS